MKNEVQKLEPEPLAVAGRGMDIQSLCEKAVERGTEGVEVLERLMVIRREMNAERAKAEFDAAMAAFQEECPAIAKGKAVRDMNGAVLYLYSPFETILAIVKPVMKKHGLSFTLDTDTDSKDGWVIATCKVTHTGGHSETSRAKFPLSQGTRAMSTTQVYAAALSFASRRVFCNALGIVTVGEDQDGGTAPTVHPGASKTTDDPARKLKKDLWHLLADVRGPEKTWTGANAWLVSHAIIKPGQDVQGLDAAALAIVLEKTIIQLDQDRGEA